MADDPARQLVRFACPACRTPLQVSSGMIGFGIHCPACRQPTYVPLPPPAATETVMQWAATKTLFTPPSSKG